MIGRCNGSWCLALAEHKREYQFSNAVQHEAGLQKSQVDLYKLNGNGRGYYLNNGQCLG